MILMDFWLSVEHFVRFVCCGEPPPPFERLPLGRGSAYPHLSSFVFGVSIPTLPRGGPHEVGVGSLDRIEQFLYS